MRFATIEQQWQLLNALGPKRALWMLNMGGMSKEIQEAYCQHRPDLVGEIENLDPELAKKYSHELELTSTDI